ncbi:MAG: zinc ribbon domain-containing protein YjdM [bacterium]|nr:zinc ribbon domain-containing protein YjdM [bacterium]
MNHFICTGTCGAVSDDLGVCEADGCTHQWELMTECDCTDGMHHREQVAAQVIVKDAHGNELHDGDSVTLIKDLPLRGSSTVLKRGTKVKSIKLTSNPQEIDCKIDGMAIVLRSEFLKKL